MSLERLSFNITTKVSARNIHLKSIPIPVSALKARGISFVRTCNVLTDGTEDLLAFTFVEKKR